MSLQHYCKLFMQFFSSLQSGTLLLKVKTSIVHYTTLQNRVQKIINIFDMYKYYMLI